MEKQMTERLVHYYDTEQHRVLCGAHGTDDHSTKHIRAVTCGECLALLREAAERASASADASSGAGV